MLALETGWTPDVLAEMPTRFLGACRWVIYARAIAGSDGLPSGEIPQGASPAVLRAALREKQQVEVLREALYPEGD